MEQNLPLEKEIAGIFAKFPPFPDNVKEILVKIAPYLCMLGVLLGGLALLAVLGVGVGVAAIGAAAYGGMAVYWISMGILAIMVVLEGLAISPLMKREKKGWNNLYYIFLLSLVNGVVGFLGAGGFVGSLISLAITFFLGGWILFQTREKYV
ncbi:MAG: hypothetical protein U0X91_08215 [Spirosomataceae bacterium]